MDTTSRYSSSLSARLFLLSAAALLCLGGLALINRSDMLLAISIWAAVIFGHFAIGVFLWLEERRNAWVAVGMGVPILWVVMLVPFLLMEQFPAAGWGMVPAGLLALSAAIIPFGRRERRRAQRASTPVPAPT